MRARSVKIILQTIFCLAFLFLAANRLIGYPESYLKFGALSIVNKYHLSNLYWVLLVLELAMAIAIWLLPRTRLLLDLGLLIYIPWLICLYLILYYSSGGCIECHYTTHFFKESFMVTTIALAVLGLMYLFVLRDWKE